MPTLINLTEPESAKLASRAFAMAFCAYTECCAEVQAAIRDMSSIVNDPDADEDEREMALSTIQDALFPVHHAGHLGMDVVAWDRLEARNRPDVASDLDQDEATFAERVGALMGRQGMSQADLADAIGVGQPAVSMMLARNSRPQARTVQRIAAALGVPAAELWPKLAD